MLFLGSLFEISYCCGGSIISHQIGRICGEHLHHLRTCTILSCIPSKRLVADTHHFSNTIECLGILTRIGTGLDPLRGTLAGVHGQGREHASQHDNNHLHPSGSCSSHVWLLPSILGVGRPCHHKYTIPRCVTFARFNATSEYGKSGIQVGETLTFTMRRITMQKTILAITAAIMLFAFTSVMAQTPAAATAPAPAPSSPVPSDDTSKTEKKNEGKGGHKGKHHGKRGQGKAGKEQP